MTTDHSQKHLSTSETTRSSSHSSPLFELVNLPSRLVLEKVYLNGLHALRRFKIRNISPHTLLVKLRSNLGSQIAFQLTNENLPEFQTYQLDASSREEDFSTRSPSPSFNQLFNYVNHIDEVEISPGCEQKIIMAFLPVIDNKGRSALVRVLPVGNSESMVGVGSPTELEDREMMIGYTTGEEEEETSEFHEINGLLFFFAYIVNTEQSVTSLKSDSKIEANDQIEKSKRSSSKEEDKLPIHDTSTHYPKADSQLTIKFRSTVCRSVLWTDVGETGINFDDCVAGGTYFKDFTIWNRSEIELYWLLNTVDLSNSDREDWLKFTDYDTGEVLDAKPVSSFSHRRIRVTFRPKEIGEFNYDLQLENANDSSNVLEPRIHAVVRSVLREESLVVSSGNVLDFGDCCAGVWSNQQLVLKNVSKAPLEIHFSSANADILFRIEDALDSSTLDFKSRSYSADTDSSKRRGRDLMVRSENASVGGSTPTDANTTSEMSVSSTSTSRAPSPALFTRDNDVMGSSTDSITVNQTVENTKSMSLYGSPKHEDLGIEEMYKNNFPNSSAFIGDPLNKKIISEQESGLVQIEDLVLRPGEEKTVIVSYKPDKDSSARDFNAGHLTRRTFRIILNYAPITSKSVNFDPTGMERKIIQCKARSCTSFVDVKPKEVNFGDADVGKLKSMPIYVTNLSELTARVELQFSSKILNASRRDFTIPPKQTIEVRLDMYPRRVNVEYKKEVTLVNLQNRDNDQIIQVISTNIDKNRVTLHSLFYRILTSTRSHYLDFGSTVLNSPNVRTFTIENVSKKKLVLELTSSLPEEIIMYQKRETVDDATKTGAPSTSTTMVDNPDNQSSSVEEIESRSSQIQRREKLLESIADKRPVKKLPSAIESSGIGSSSRDLLLTNVVLSNVVGHHDTSFADGSSAAYLDLAASSAKDARRPPRRRPHKLQPGKNVGPAGFDRIKESNGTTTNTSGSTLIISGLVDDSYRKENEAYSGDSDSRWRSTFNSASNLHKQLSMTEPIEFSHMPVETIVAAFVNSKPISSLLFPKSAVEETYVRNQINLRRELSDRIAERQIVRISTVVLEPGTERQIIVVFIPDGQLRQHIQGLPKTQDARILLRLVEFDQDIEQPEFENLIHGDLTQIPVRELLVRSTLCRSIMDLGQKNINFGVMDKNERRNKSIVIQNRSEVPLLYNIRKSGSIASGDLVFNSGRMGVIRGYGKKEVEFRFSPSLAGQFHERLFVENIQDNKNSSVISVKANIRRQSIFFIQSLNIDFGACLINETAARAQQIVISNMLKQSRTFEVRFDTQELKYNSCYGDLHFVIQDDVEGAPLPSGLISEEIQEEIEGLEQKVKIAKRKGQGDKAKKIEKRIARLRRGEVGRDTTEDEQVILPETSITQTSELLPKEDKLEAINDSHQPSTEELLSNRQESDIAKIESVEMPRRTATVISSSGKDTPKYKRTENSIIFPLEGRSTKTILVYFKAISTKSAAPGETDERSDFHALTPLTLQQVNGRIFVHEHKNTDIVKHITFRTVVYYDHSLYSQALEKDGSLLDTNPVSVPILAQNLQKTSVTPTSNTVSRTEATDANESEHSLPSFAHKMLATPLSHVVEAISSILPDHRHHSNSRTIKDADSSDSHTTPMENVEPLQEHLVIEPTTLDIGRLEVNQKHSYYFKISNRGDVELHYEIFIPKGEESFFQINELTGTLAPSTTQRVDFTVKAEHVGRQAHSLLIHDLTNKRHCKFTLQGYIHYTYYLKFPSLGEDGQAELDLGYCYVDPERKYSQVTPLLVENVTDQDLYISCQSNLSQQVCIFLDERGERGQVIETLLRARTMMTVWVALRPNLLGTMLGAGWRNTNMGAAGTGGQIVAATSTNTISEDRTLVGGIKFTIRVKEVTSSLPTSLGESPADQASITEEKLIMVTSQTVKFTSLIGVSVLSLSDTLITLGSTSTLGEPIYGSFKLRNMSRRLPLDYVVECPSGNIIFDRTHGTLEGWGLETVQIPAGMSDAGEVEVLSGEIDIEDKSQRIISFRVTPSKYGLFRDIIVVNNENHTGQTFEIEVRLFVDEELLHITKKDIPENNIDGLIVDTDLKFADSIKESERLPALVWNNVCVAVIDEESNVESKVDVVESDSEIKAVIQKSSSAATTPSYEVCVEVSNASRMDTVQILPKSNFDVDIRWESSEGSHFIQAKANDMRNADDNVFRRCGTSFEMFPSSKAYLYVSCPFPTMLKKSDSIALNQGKLVNTAGLLLLYDKVRDVAVKAIELLTNYYVSKGELSTKMIDLGKIGHSNSWADVSFQFTVKNLSSGPLQYQLDSPECIEILEEDGKSSEPMRWEAASKHIIPARDERLFSAVLKPRQIDSFSPGERTFDVNVFNMYNPNNVMTLKLKATLTLLELQFDRLVRGELVLPALYHPIPKPDAPCDSWFTISNTSDDDIRFEIGVELAPDVSQFVRVEVLSRFSNSPLIGSVSVSAHGSIEVRVRAYPIENVRIPQQAAYLVNPDGVGFGKLWLATKSAEGGVLRVSKNIPIRGVITESSTFFVPEKRIVFKTALYTSDNDATGEYDQRPSMSRRSSVRKSRELVENTNDEGSLQRDSFVICNLSEKIPLQFRITVEGPLEVSASEVISISDVDENGCGVVGVGQKMALFVELKDSDRVISEDIKIFIEDKESLTSQRQTILVGIISERRERRAATKGRKDEATETPTVKQSNNKHDTGQSRNKTKPLLKTSSDLPVINLRGCKRIDETVGRYELDLGQQDLGSPTITRKITLENTSMKEISYKVKSVSPRDKSWLKISRTEDTLEASTDEHRRVAHQLTLSFFPTVRSTFLTYLIIENMDNPADTKTIRVIMEVVARQNLRRGASVPMENNHVFDIYVNGVDPDQPYIEMLNLFHGSEYSARSMVVHNRETIPLEFTFQTNLDYDDGTEMAFSTSRTSAKLFKTLVVDPESNVRVYIRLRPLPSREIQQALDKGIPRDPSEVEEKNIEIYVNCRLVKDYQQTVKVKAECRMPSLRVHYSDNGALMGKISRHNEEWTVKFEQEYRTISIENLLDSPLDYEIVNDTVYFELDIPDDDKRAAPRSKRLVNVRPNYKAIINNIESVRREKYIQENVTVYNKNRPSENYWIPLQMSFGHISNFQLASGYRNSYAYGVIENHIVQFLSDFNSHTALFASLAEADDGIKCKMVDLEFRYFYIVDQLVHCSTNKTGENWFQVALLLFGTVLGSNIFQKYAPAYLKKPQDADAEARIWPPLLAKWVSPLNYFVSFFPIRNSGIETLRELHRSLIIVDKSLV